MTADRAALVAGILANPDDDTPRLVAADWFEENGDSARAEFIRVQVNRARLPPTDPQQPELAARELHLLKEHAERWMGAHFAFKKCRFRRGFIEYVHLHLTHFLHHRRELLALEPVRDISLTGWMRATASLVSRVAGCEELRNIETLRFHHQGPHKHPRGECAILLDSPHLTGLKKLHFSMISVTTEERRRIERSPAFARVRELTLPYLDTFPHQPGEWFQDGVPKGALANVRALRVGGYGLQAALGERLAGMSFWKKLEALHAPIAWSQTEALDALRTRLPRTLRSLHITGSESNALNAAGAVPAFFARVAELPLTDLSMQHIDLHAETLTALLSGAPRLQRFALTAFRRNGQESAAEVARVVAATPAVRDASDVQLAVGCILRGDTAEALFGGHLRNVARFDVLGTGLSDEACEALGHAEWPALHALRVTGYGVARTALRALFASPACRNIVSLRYSGSFQGMDPFGPACATALAKLPHLSSVRLDTSSVSAASRKALAHVPWLHVANANNEYWGDDDPNVCAPVDDELKHADQGA